MRLTEHQVDWTKKISPHHLIIKIQSIQNKERILRAAKENDQVIHKGRPIRITPDFSMETLKARRSWTNVLQTRRDHEFQSRILHSGKLSITIDEESKIFHDKNRFKQYLSTNPGLQKVLEGKL